MKQKNQTRWLPLAVIIAMFLVGFVLANQPVQAQETLEGRVVSEEYFEDPNSRAVYRIVQLVPGDGSEAIPVFALGGPTSDGMWLDVSHQPELPLKATVRLTNTTPADADTVTVLKSAGYSGPAPVIVDHENETIVRAERSSSESHNFHWIKEDMPLEFRVAHGGPSFALKEIKAGMNVWVDESCSFVTASHSGRITNDFNAQRGGDGINGIFWEDNQDGHFRYNPQRLGEAWRILDQKTWEITEFDIILNSSQKWSSEPKQGFYDLRTAVAHEFGHGLGFKHTSEHQNIMTTYLTSGVRREIGSADREMLYKNYKSKACGGSGGPANPAPRPTPAPGVKICNGKEVTVDLALGQTPTEGNDVIRGTSGDDRIDGLGGHDVICGLAGNDRIVGGEGNDKIFGQNGDDTIRGRTGDDTIHGGNGNDVLHGGGGHDKMLGGAGDDSMSGSSGDDRLGGGPGNDKLQGYGGADRLAGGSGNDDCDGGSGKNTYSRCERKTS